MQTGTVDRPPRAHGSEHQDDHGKEQGTAVDTEPAAPAELTKNDAKASTNDGTTPTNTNEVQPAQQEQREPTALGLAEARSQHSGLSVSERISLLVDELRTEEEFVDEDNMPLPESDPDMTENILEVDDEDGEHTEPIYATSHYPAIPVRYRIERFDSATM